MSISSYVPLEHITVSGGALPYNFYPIWVNDWGQASVNIDQPLTLEGWLLAGGNATGPILVNYADVDYENDPNKPFFLARKSYVDSQVNVKRTELNGYLLKTGGTLNSPLRLLSETTNPDAAVTVDYVEKLASQYLRTESLTESQQQVTGPITLHSTHTDDYAAQDAIPAKYVSDAIQQTVRNAENLIGSDYLPTAGGTVKGHISVPTPVNDCHAATLGFLKKYLAEKKKEYFENRRVATV